MKEVINPFTGRKVMIDSKTYNLLKVVFEIGKNNNLSETQEHKLYNNLKNNKKYRNSKKSVFCGPDGGDKDGTFPVTSQEECRAALSYAHDAPNPAGIRRCALRKAKEKGWKCGSSYSKSKISNILNVSTKSRKSSKKSSSKKN